MPDLVHSLAAQLCQAPQLTAYRDHVMRSPALQTILALRSCVTDPAAALTRGILEPLQLLRRTGQLAGETCLVVIDALCEAEYHKPGKRWNESFLGHCRQKKELLGEKVCDH